MIDDGQRDLFNLGLGERLRDLAIEQVDDNADPDWRDAAIVAVNDVARAAPFLTADDVWPAIAPGYETHEGRAMGAVIKRAAGLGWIEPTDRFTKSRRKTCHAMPRRIWRSLLFDQAATASSAGQVAA